MSVTNGGGEGLAPVIPLFGSAPTAWNDTWASSPVDGAADAPASAEDRDEDAQQVVDAGEAALLRKLRTRSLSVREARAVLIERGLDEASADAVVDRFVRNAYLDDAKLAEQLVHSGIERKGQGRGAIMQTLSSRGIPGDIVSAALDELPGDEFDRALEFARERARRMRDLDRDVALRRLSAQLARRGYGGRAFEAARRALDELGRPTRTGVRFEP